jgi:hypothetical protein
MGKRQIRCRSKWNNHRTRILISAQKPLQQSLMQLHEAPDHQAHPLELQGGGVGLSIAPSAVSLKEVPQSGIAMAILVNAENELVGCTLQRL